METEEYLKRWEEFKKQGYLYERLSDEELDIFLAHCAEQAVPALSSQARFFQLLTEKSSRIANRFANTSVMLARVAVGVGVVQVVLGIVQIVLAIRKH